MIRISLFLLTAGLLVGPVFAQPRVFSDDFLTNATYDSTSWYAGCYGSGPLTKYTALELIDRDDIFNSRAVSGNGRLVMSHKRETNNMGSVPFVLTIVGAVDPFSGQFCGMPGAPDQTFTDSDICIYGGIMFDAFDLRPDFNRYGYGADGAPGVAGVDDDCDGQTDEPDESPIHAGGNTYGPPYPDGGSASCPNAPSDGLPGIGGVDDDGDGTVDNYGELGMGNDSDDNGGMQSWYVIMKLRVNLSPYLVYLKFCPGSSGMDLFSLRHVVYGLEAPIEFSNEMPPGYYQPNIHYNYSFCASGTSFGAKLWAGTDMANPAETLGPVINTDHTESNASLVGLGMSASEPQYQRAKKWLGNSNFSDTFWVCEGNLCPTEQQKGDLDGDKDVDGYDFLTFSNCYNGSNRPPLVACENPEADIDGDGDVDGYDFLTFSNCFNGSNQPPRCQ